MRYSREESDLFYSELVSFFKHTFLHFLRIYYFGFDLADEWYLVLQERFMVRC